MFNIYHKSKILDRRNVMNIRAKSIVASTILWCCLAATRSGAMTADEIIMKVDEVMREADSTMLSKIELTTCKYTVANNRMKCTEKPRVTIIENIRRDYGPDLRDSRAVSIVLEPLRDKGIGMLSYQYEEMNKENDTWLYLPTLGKVKRIISSSDGGGSFFGSEFLVEDMETRKVQDYSYEIIEETKYNGRDVWVIASRLNPDKARKSVYGKILSWVDKERFFTLKEDLYNRNMKRSKQKIMRNIQKIDNVWVAKKISMNNLETRRISNMEFLSVTFNIDVANEMFSQRILTDRSFREKNIEKLRASME
ncbi:MAG: outer membrane lipoprotein-sorting protein [Chitinivibrionales bacterium]|nr:outer membrane lipoprotein-sorting protein [Chitinivibrionales bacterium]